MPGWMPSFRIISPLLILMLSVGPLFADTTDLETQRQIFLRAEHALKKNQRVHYDRLAEQITEYPLYPYLVYEELKQLIQAAAHPEQLAQDIKAFEQDFPDFPLLRQLKKMWLYQLGKHQQWGLFHKSYVATDDAGLGCYYVYSEYQIKPTESSLKAALPLWLVGYSQPNECETLFKLAKAKNVIGHNEVLERYKLALIDKNFDLSKHLIKSLPKEQKTIALLWEKTIKDPYLIFKPDYVLQFKNNKKSAPILVHALQVIAKREPEKTLKWWQNHQASMQFTADQKAIIERDIAVYLAHAKHPQAHERLMGLDEKTMDSVAKEWRVRLALLEKDWTAVLHWIAHLDAEKQKDNEWLYWTARAHDGLHHHQLAQQFYEKLALERNYYGFLASHHLKRPISLKHQAYTLTAAMQQKVKERPAIQRFYEFLAIKRPASARLEWFRAVDKMSEEEILACAKIAQKLKMPDVAIFTMSKAKYKDDVHLRFPLAYYDDIMKNAKHQKIDPAWIFAIARQESAFHTEATSHRGARGLLQLLPTTAGDLAKKNAIAFPSERTLYEPDKNIQLGSIYLKNLKKSMNDSIILATASYNAGPTKASQWLPKQSIEADIWIENIPYRETREYVKNVLAFTSIYHMQLGGASAMTSPNAQISPLKT